MHRALLRIALAALMIAAGVAHLVAPGIFEPMMPPYLPAPRALILLSGVFEILGGLGLLWSRTRRAAGFGLVLLYLAVFPANLHLALNPVPTLFGVEVSPLGLWLRLPFQLVFIAWALYATRPAPR